MAEGRFIEVVMEEDVSGTMRHLVHRRCAKDERDIIETSGTVMPNGMPARKGTRCSTCGEELKWEDR